jgi:hypothetical protein
MNAVQTATISVSENAARIARAARAVGGAVIEGTPPADYDIPF